MVDVFLEAYIYQPVLINFTIYQSDTPIIQQTKPISTMNFNKTSLASNLTIKIKTIS